MLTFFLFFAILVFRKGGNKMTKDYFKRLTVKNMTAWDLNCRHVIPHKKKHNRLERIFKRKNRRKIKKMLDKYCD